MRKKADSRQPASKVRASESRSTRAPAKPAAKKAAAVAVTKVIPDMPAKARCKGATRYGDPCRFWALPNGEFCYWCEQAGRPRYPLPKLTGEAARAATAKEVHKKRCQGVTVFGDQCRFWAVGTGDYCLWCSRSAAASAKQPTTAEQA
jgi:hypothetical protein